MIGRSRRARRGAGRRSARRSRAWTATPDRSAGDPAAGLLLDLAGEAMRARLFVVQGEGDAEACLRPDFTIPVARAHIAAGETRRPLPLRGQGLPRRAARLRPRARSSCRSAWRRSATAATRPWTARSPPWPGASAVGRRPRATSRLVLGDVALFSAFVDALGLRRAAGGAAEARLRPAPRAARGAGPQPRPPAAAAAPGRPGLRPARRPARGGGHRGAGGRLGPGRHRSRWAAAPPAEIVHRLVQRAEAAHAPRLTEAEAGLMRDFLEISDRPRAALAASPPWPAGRASTWTRRWRAGPNGLRSSSAPGSPRRG